MLFRSVAGPEALADGALAGAALAGGALAGEALATGGAAPGASVAQPPSHNSAAGNAARTREKEWS